MLGEEIKHLVRLAYPDASVDMLDILAKDQFIDTLPDEDIRLRLRQNKPGTLQQALEEALELESIYLANNQRSKNVREVQLESPTPTALVNKTDLEKGTFDMLRCILDAVQWGSNKPRGESPNYSGGRPRPSGK